MLLKQWGEVVFFSIKSLVRGSNQNFVYSVMYYRTILRNRITFYSSYCLENQFCFRNKLFMVVFYKSCSYFSSTAEFYLGYFTRWGSYFCLMEVFILFKRHFYEKRHAYNRNFSLVTLNIKFHWAMFIFVTSRWDTCHWVEVFRKHFWLIYI